MFSRVRKRLPRNGFFTFGIKSDTRRKSGGVKAIASVSQREARRFEYGEADGIRRRLYHRWQRELDIMGN